MSQVEAAKSSAPSLVRSTRLVSALTMLSRFFGLMREQLVAALLGGGVAADAFVTAFRIPNLLRDLLAEGALSAAFVPTFARVHEQQSKARAFELGQRVFGVLGVFVGLLTLLAYFQSDALVHLLSPGFAEVPGKIELTAKLTRVMLPFLMFISFAAVAMGMLNAQHVFGPPALAPTAFNIVTILFGLGLLFLNLTPEQTVVGWAIGTVVGGASQFLVQLPALLRTGFRFRLRFGLDEDVKAMLKLMGPAIIGLAATQINIVVNTQLASDYEGAQAALNYAFRLLYLPIGVFGVAIATTSTASLARQFANNDIKSARQTLRQSLSLLAFLCVPSSVGLWVLSEPIIAMIYQRRAFTAGLTHSVAQATAVYSLGLFAYSAVKVLAPVYYAQRRTHIPLIASALSVIANIVVSYFAREKLGFLAMALGTSVAAWVNIAVLSLSLGDTGRFDADESAEKRRHIVTFLKVCIASLLMGAAGVFLIRLLPDDWMMRGEIIRWSLGLGLTALCGVIYLLFAQMLRIGEVHMFTGVIMRRLKRKR